MKAGQIASYMPGALPPAAQQVLARAAGAVDADGVRADRRGARAPSSAHARALFDDIDERAVRRGVDRPGPPRACSRGRPVAVKVQYPGIEDVIRSDLRMVGVIARLSTIGSHVDGGALAAELRDRLLEECDYVREADNQRAFAALLAQVAGRAACPRSIAERSTRRVLTTRARRGASRSTTSPRSAAARRTRRRDHLPRLLRAAVPALHLQRRSAPRQLPRRRPAATSCSSTSAACAASSRR